MTTFSKVLAVAVAAFSVAFLGFVLVMLAGGPNWRAEMSVLVDERYDFERSTGDVPTWTSQRAGQTVGSSPVAPKVVVAARRDWLQRQNAESTALTAERDRLRGRIDQLRPWIQTDQQAFLNRRDSLLADVNALETQVRDLAQKVAETADKGRETQELAKARREEGYRIEEQVDEALADSSRLADERKLLEIRLRILEGNLDRLERIEANLAGRLPDEEPAASDDAAGG